MLRRIDEQASAPHEHELLAGVLRILGEYAFETHRRHAHETREAFLRLSEQVYVGECSALFPFLQEQRQDEQQFVNGQMNDLRDLTWNLLDALAKTVEQEAQDDAALQQQVRQISLQVNNPNSLDVQSLRQTLQAMTEIIAHREQRHQATLRQLESQVNHLMRELDQARRESTTDPLTGLYNRRAFENCLGHAVGLNRLFGYPATMLLIDIDHFKRVNDTYGHAVGDLVLKAVAAQIVRVCKRKSDLAARYGGEEFAVIMRDTTLREAQRIAQQLVVQVRQHPIPVPDGEPIRVTISVGLGELADGESAEEWFRRTDALLYQAKQGGRNRVAA
ncbi:MAG: GGDEF domain-containing protein [Fimbriimonadales bacterium]